MGFGRAFTYIFDDPEWISKLAILVLVTFVAVVTIPLLLIGLLLFCVALGYMLDIIDNVHHNRKVILPKWDNFGEWLTRGAPVLLAISIYNLPFIIFAMCALFIPGVFVDEAVRGLGILILACCLGPLLLIYTIATWMMMAVAIGRYARGAKAGVFYQIGELFTVIQNNSIISFQWLLYSFLANIIFLIPCIGWIIGAVMSIPIQGYLIGQYSRQLDSKPPKYK